MGVEPGQERYRAMFRPLSDYELAKLASEDLDSVDQYGLEKTYFNYLGVQYGYGDGFDGAVDLPVGGISSDDARIGGESIA